MTLPPIRAMGRAAAEAYQPEVRAVCIGMHDYGSPASRLSAHFLDELHLHCSDWWKRPPFPSPPMTGAQAEKVLAFVDRWREEVDEIVVHCLYGRSRAPSLAMALRAAYGESVRWRPPNPLLARTVLRAARARAVE